MKIDQPETDSTLQADGPLPRWMQAVEEAVDMQVAATRHLQWQQQQLATKAQEAQTQWLQSGWDSAKQRIEELSKSTGRLETELAAEQAKAINLALVLNAANEHNNQLQNEYNRLETGLNAANEHNNQLQNELNVTSAKVHELSHESHHWWTVADQLNQQQQSIYASKFWRLTWPLRKIMQATKWTLLLPARAVRWALRLPKRSGWKMTSSTSHSSGTGSDPQNAIAAVYPPNMSEESINNLSPRTARIYNDLKKAIEARKN